MSEKDLEELKKKKLEELKESQAGKEAAGMKDQQEQVRKQIKALASKILTREARSRLGNIRAANPDLSSQIELQLVQLHRSGQIRNKITDDQLKDLLESLRSSKKERKIKHR